MSTHSKHITLMRLLRSSIQSTKIFAALDAMSISYAPPPSLNILSSTTAPKSQPSNSGPTSNTNIWSPKY